METKILYKNELPFLLQQINDPPEKLYIQGELPLPTSKILCVVGSRKYSSYGKEVTEKLIAGLKGYNICIVSGMALGIDGFAHRAALEAGLHTIAFPGSGLDPSVIYPAGHALLAREILRAGGALISECEMTQISAPWTFPKRNRLLAGISHATLVIEAGLQSGTLITSKYATDYNRDVGAVPGNIYSPLSEGPHQLLGSGAKVITSSDDILELLDLKKKGEHENPVQKTLLLNLGENEKQLLEYITIEPHTIEQLIYKTGLSAQEINLAISSLEIEGVIIEKNGKVRVA